MQINPSFIRDKCCHLTSCLHLTEPNRHHHQFFLLPGRLYCRLYEQQQPENAIKNTWTNQELRVIKKHTFPFSLLSSLSVKVESFYDQTDWTFSILIFFGAEIYSEWFIGLMGDVLATATTKLTLTFPTKWSSLINFLYDIQATKLTAAIHKKQAHKHLW